MSGGLLFTDSKILAPLQGNRSEPDETEKAADEAALVNRLAVCRLASKP